VSKDCQIFAVAGKPIIHSKSPIIFNLHFQNNNKRFYIRIANETAEELIEIIKDLSISGVNITAPYKSEVIPYLDELDETAREIEAVNLIKNINGKLIGYNCDTEGIRKSLINLGISFQNKKCLVVGGGGAASAAVYTAVNSGAKVIVINRDIKKAKELSKKFNCKYGSLDKFGFYVNDTDIIINTIPLDVLNLNLLNRSQVLLNADYKKQVGNVDFKFIDGKKWLVEQAVASLKIFTNEKMSSSVFEKYLDKEINKTRNNIALVGFAGSGKSVIGKSLARRLGFDFIDTDIIIEEKTGETINSIFKNKGEDYFRKVESDILKSLTEKTNTVIATGGGIVLNNNNRGLLKKISYVFWIYSNIKTCYARLKNSLNPPKFDVGKNKKQDLETFNEIFQYRLKNYCDVSDVLIYNNRSIEEVIDRIYYEINQKI